MYEKKRLTNLDDYFLSLNSRRQRGVYFCRVNGYNEGIKRFIQKYYEAARLSGVVIEGKIPNPNQKNLSYYEEIMGLDFQLSLGFINASLTEWLPRMNAYQRKNVTIALYDTLDAMRKEGKNENMLKNAYIKFMCWLYYKFERILNQLGENQVPKILYEGQVSIYELMLLTVLVKAGCDVVLLQYAGDENYLKLDRASAHSDAIALTGLGPFPAGFSLQALRKEIQIQMNNERLYGIKPELLNCTNAWIEEPALDAVKKSIQMRGDDPKLYYNCFIRMNGVEDKLTYLNELYQLQLEISNGKRNVVIVDHVIESPSPAEINTIARRNYKNRDQMLVDLSANIKYSANIELQRLMNKAFIDMLLEESKMPDTNLNKLTNQAVYLLCWLKRYQPELFSNWKAPDIACFIYLGGCKNENEAMFLRMLARLPIDVVILNPNLNQTCCLVDDVLYEVNHTESLNVRKYPRENSDIQMGTAAYHAERELDSIMYQDSGIYRNQQYDRANTISLQTMYEEIFILWKQEGKYRPNFSVIDSVVTVPVIFAKVSGVKDGNLPKYWADIKSLMGADTFLIKAAPYMKGTDENLMKPFVTDFFKNGRLQPKKIKEHKCYPYSFLRDEMQNHMLEKLQLLIEQKWIKGTFENGTEYTIIATVLNLNKEIIRMIQKFDFTKNNPKVIYINTTEETISLEDSILIAFLNLVGFDVVLFVPTGYQIAEKFFNKRVMEEHQIGDYIYDLTPPRFETLSNDIRQTWREKFFRRGGS